MGLPSTQQINQSHSHENDVFPSSSKVDYLLQLIDEESTDVISDITPGEVSGPPFRKDINHYYKDKKKLAKQMKNILNKIYLLNPSNFEAAKELKVYGVQFYCKCCRLLNV
jgi:hypothetical protein